MSEIERALGRLEGTVAGIADKVDGMVAFETREHEKLDRRQDQTDAKIEGNHTAVITKIETVNTELGAKIYALNTWRWKAEGIKIGVVSLIGAISGATAALIAVRKLFENPTTAQAILKIFFGA